jgi:hypothetical protein
MGAEGAQDPHTPLRDAVPRLDSSAGRTGGVLDALARGRRGKVSRTDNALRPVRSGPGIDAIAVTLLLASLTSIAADFRDDGANRGAYSEDDQPNKNEGDFCLPAMQAGS